MGKTYKLLTIVGTSPKSFEEAVQNALADAAASIRNLCWFEVQEMRGSIEKGAVAEYQVKVAVGFRVEES